MGQTALISFPPTPSCDFYQLAFPYLQLTLKPHPINLPTTLRQHLSLKLLLTVALTLFITLPYFTLQRYVLFEARELLPSPIDLWIPFSDHWIWMYQSLYLLIPLAPFLMTQKNLLIAYSFGLVIISVMCDLFFLFLPTRCPRPSVEGTSAFYQWFVSVESNLNAFPSMHVALAVYATLAVWALWRDKGWLRWLPVVWCMLVIYSTMGAKQHFAVDVFAGFALGGFVYYGWLRKPMKVLLTSRLSPLRETQAGF